MRHFHSILCLKVPQQKITRIAKKRGWSPCLIHRYTNVFYFIFGSFGLIPAQQLTIQNALMPNQSINCTLPLNAQGPVQRMEPLSSLQVQYTVPSPEHTRSCTEEGAPLKLTGTVHCSLPWTHKVLYRGGSPSQAYRYSILFPPLNTQGPVQRREPLSSLQVQYTVPSPEHTRSCTEEGSPSQAYRYSTLFPPPEHRVKVLCRGWNPSQAYRYSTLSPPTEHTRSCAEDGTPLKLTGIAHCSLPWTHSEGPMQRMEPFSSLQVQYTISSP